MDINATLKRAYCIAGWNKETFGVKITDITNEDITGYNRNSKPCFFLRRELGLTLAELRETKQYRHCKMYKDGYLDYIARKEFSSIEEWVRDCDASLDDVMFGFNKFDGKNTHISLVQLLDHLDPVQLPETKEMVELNEFMNKLGVDNLKLQDLLVNTGTCIKTYNQYMEA